MDYLQTDLDGQVKLLDHFAGQALNALILKMPFYDLKGEFGKQVSQEELTVIKEGVAKTAYEYASYMLIHRKDSLEWMKKNKKFLESEN